MDNCPGSSKSELKVMEGEANLSSNKDTNMISQPRKSFKRKVIIEPAMALFFMFHAGSFSLYGQYVYYAIGEKYNLTSKLAESNSGNNTTLDQGPCGSAVDGNSDAYKLQQRVQAESATFTIILDISGAVPMLISTLFSGTLF